MTNFFNFNAILFLESSLNFIYKPLEYFIIKKAEEKLPKQMICSGITTYVGKASLFHTSAVKAAVFNVHLENKFS